MHERDAFVRGTACIFRYIDQIIWACVRKLESAPIQLHLNHHLILIIINLNHHFFGLIIKIQNWRSNWFERPNQFDLKIMFKNLIIKLIWFPQIFIWFRFLNPDLNWTEIIIVKCATCIEWYHLRQYIWKK